MLLELSKDGVQCSARSLRPWQHLAECQSSAHVHVQAWLGGLQFPMKKLVSKLLASLHHYQLSLLWSCWFASLSI